jgi:pectate lyase
MKLKKMLSASLAVVLIAVTISSCSKSDPLTDAKQAAVTSSSSKSAATVSFAVATPDGFASGATGGAGGSSVTVSSASAFKTAAESTAAQIITISGNLNLGTVAVSINSNKTIIGADSNSGVIGNLTISNKTNVIVQNLNITNPNAIGTGDGLEVSGSTKVYITKCTFTDCADGNLDIVRAADNVTVSWCKFRYVNQTTHNFCNLIGNDDGATGDRGKLHVTMHHNWYDIGVVERQPRVRYGYVHCYNNYYGSNSDNYTVGVGVEAHILLENNYFENQARPWADYTSGKNRNYELQWNSSNVFVNSPIPTWATNSPTTFSRPYSYSLLTGSDIKTAVTGGAGNN